MLKRIPWQGLVLPFVLVATWFGLSRFGLINTGLVPRIADTWDAFMFLLQRGELSLHLRVSLLRVVTGFAAASCTAVPLGIALGWIPGLRPWISPSLHFLRQIPPVAWIPLFIMWFGIGEASKNAVIFYAAFFPILLNAQFGVEQIPRSLWEVADLYRFSRIKSLRTLVLPGSAVPIITGLRLGMGMSWRALVAAEMLAASRGLGYLIMTARSLVRLDEMVVGMLVIGCMGMAIDAFFSQLESRLLPWTQGVSGVTLIGRKSYGRATVSDKPGI